VLYLSKSFRFIELPFKFTGRYFLFLVFGLIIVKQGLLSFLDLEDPLRHNKISKIFNFVGIVTLSLSFIFKIYHWPYSTLLGLLSVASFILSLVFSLINSPNSVELKENDDLIDDNF
jgi:hypothetical protein